MRRFEAQGAVNGFLLACLLLVMPLAAAGELEAPALITGARAALERGDTRAIRRMVAADRAAAYEAVDNLLNDSASDSHQLIDRLASDYEAVFSDPCLVERAATFRSWTPEQQTTRALGVQTKKAAIEAFSEGRLEEARSKLEEALALFRLVGDLREEGRTTSNLGAVAGYAGDGASALTRLDEASRIARRSGDLPLLVAIENNRAFTLQDQGDMEGALSALESTLPLAESLGDRQAMASMLMMAGGLSLNEGDLATAREKISWAVRLGRQIHDSELEANARVSLAAVKHRGGDLRGASRELRRASEIADRSDLPPLQASIELRLAGLARESRNLPMASLHLQRARVAAARTDSVLLSAEVEHQEALLRIREGRHAEAARLLEVAEERIGGLDASAMQAEIRGAKAVARFYLGDYENALSQAGLAVEAAAAASRHELEAIYRRALGWLLAVLGDVPSGISEVEKAAVLHRQRKDLPELARDLHAIGAMRFRADDLRGAREALERAAEAYPDNAALETRAEVIFDLAAVELASGPGRQSAGFSLLQEARAAFESLDDDYGILQSALLEVEGSLDAGDSGAAREALRRIEEFDGNPGTAEFDWRIHLLEGRTAEISGDFSGAARAYARSVAAVEKLRGGLTPARWRAAILEDRIAPYRSLVRLHLKQGAVERAYQVARSAKARTFTEELSPPSVGDISVPAPEAPKDMLPAPTAPLSRLRHLLSEDETLLDYFFAGDQLLVFILRHDGLTHRVLRHDGNLPAELEGLIKIFRFPGRPDPGEELVTRAWKSAGARLREILLDPIEPVIASGEHLLIVPNGPLHGVPFAALSWKGKYLVETLSLSILPAAETLLSRRNKGPEGPASTLIMGDPTFADPAERLPGAADEARTVASLSSPGVVLLLGEEAREAAFRDRADTFDRIHLAAHGRIDRVQPTRSYVALSPGDGEDGRLEAGEIAGMRTAASLVVLSGCETGIEGGIIRDDPPGDERAGLVRAFLAAGARVVVGGLWEMDDLAARWIIPELYPNLDGRSVASALALLQRDLLAGNIRGEGDTPFTHPFYWAGLQAYGAGTEVTPDSPLPVQAEAALKVVWEHEGE